MADGDVNYFMNSTFTKARCYEVKTDDVSQSDINTEKLGDFDILLPSIEEQIEIFRILDKERNILEIWDIYDSRDVIKKSILANALRCELGSHDSKEISRTSIIEKLI